MPHIDGVRSPGLTRPDGASSVPAPKSVEAPAGGRPFVVPPRQVDPTSVAVPTDGQFAAAAVAAGNGPAGFVRERLAACESTLSRINAEMKALRSAGVTADDPAMVELENQKMEAFLKLQASVYEMSSSVAIVSQVVGSASNAVRTLMSSQS